MQYHGGKARIARRIARKILALRGNSEHYLEPFMGGASVLTQVAPHFTHVRAGDAMPDLVMFWSAVQSGWLPPESISRKEYDALRNAEPSALRAFAGFGCSFGGKWFGGYARHDPRPGRRSWALISARDAMGKMNTCAHVSIFHRDYRDWGILPGTAIYCDPPYANTTPYGAVDGFDHAEFWQTMDSWSDQGARVFVSEHIAPDHWLPIWEHESTASLKATANNGKRIERLFISESYWRKALSR